jgi:hypothetical protein
VRRASRGVRDGSRPCLATQNRKIVDLDLKILLSVPFWLVWEFEFLLLACGGRLIRITAGSH